MKESEVPTLDRYSPSLEECVDFAGVSVLKRVDSCKVTKKGYWIVQELPASESVN